MRNLPPHLKPSLANSDSTRTPPSPANFLPGSVLSYPGKKCFVKNEIRYEFKMRYHELKVGPSRKEDVMFAYREPKTEERQNELKKKRLTKILKFRQMLDKKLDSDK